MSFVSLLAAPCSLVTSAFVAKIRERRPLFLMTSSSPQSSKMIPKQDGSRPSQDEVQQQEGQQLKRRYVSTRWTPPAPGCSSPSFRFLPFHLDLMEHLHKEDIENNNNNRTMAPCNDCDDSDKQKDGGSNATVLRKAGDCAQPWATSTRATINDDLARVREHLLLRGDLLSSRIEADRAASIHREARRLLPYGIGRDDGEQNVGSPPRNTQGDDEEWEDHLERKGRNSTKRSKWSHRDSSDSTTAESTAATRNMDLRTKSAANRSSEGTRHRLVTPASFGVVEHQLGLQARDASETASRRNRNAGVSILREACRRRIDELRKEHRAQQNRADEQTRRCVDDLLSGTIGSSGSSTTTTTGRTGTPAAPLASPTNLVSDRERSELVAAACKLKLWTLLAQDVEMLGSAACDD